MRFLHTRANRLARKYADPVSDKPDSFVCECGYEHFFVSVVYDHWEEPVRHTCAVCNRVHMVQRGVATLVAREWKRGKRCSVRRSSVRARWLRQVQW